MVALKDTAGKRLPAGANPAIHWNTFLKVGSPCDPSKRHFWEKTSTWSQPSHPLEQLSKGRQPLVVPWCLRETLLGENFQLEPTLPSTENLSKDKQLVVIPWWLREAILGKDFQLELILPSTGTPF
jgi:hypothetical protein